MFELRTSQELVIELSSSFNHFRDQRMNNTLYILTIVTTCVTPMSLMTGLFGMNFADDSPLGLQDPILSWEHGYKFFWALSITTTILLCVLFRYWM